MGKKPVPVGKTGHGVVICPVLEILVGSLKPGMNLGEVAVGFAQGPVRGLEFHGAAAKDIGCGRGYQQRAETRDGKRQRQRTGLADEDHDRCGDHQ
jgi:hypothetical protein